MQFDSGVACGSCGTRMYDGCGGLCGTCMALKTTREEEARDTIPCGQCFRGTRNWERTVCFDGKPYCHKCAEGVQAVYDAENSCMACGKAIGPREPRIYPPERIQTRDEWVKTGRIKRRFVCRTCFESMTVRKFGIALRVKPRHPVFKRMRVLLGIGGN